MMRRVYRERGYFLMIAVIFILVIGVMGSLIGYLFANRAQLSVAQQFGLRDFYIAESGVEIGTRLLTMSTLNSPARIACGSITSLSAITNAAMDNGRFTIITINSSPIFAVDTLNGASTSTDTIINLNSTSGFAPSGRVLVDREAIDYTAISGDTLIGVTRGIDGTLASSHANGASVGQYQCSLDVQSGIPNLISSSYQHELQWNVELQDAWAVGAASGNNFTLVHWNQPTELAWNEASFAGGSNAANLNSVSMLNSAEGWAVGDRANSSFIFLHWNGATWSVMAIAGSCSGQHLVGVSMVSSQEGWTVGGRYKPACGGGSAYRYTVMRWNGSNWSLLTPASSPNIPADASTNQDLNAVHVIDTDGDGLANVGFTVGASGRVLQYNGSNWVLASGSDVVSQALNGVYTVSANDAWAVGASGVILHWNGSAWSSFSSPTNTTLNAVAMLDTNKDGLADSGWAVGNNGIIIIYNGSTWVLATSNVNNNLFGIDIINSQDAWASGASGTLVHWNGTAWDSVASGTNHALNSINFMMPRQTSVSAWRQIFH